MIKVISFDIGGTLITNEEQDSYTLRDLANLLNKPYEDVKKAYKNTFQIKIGTMEELINLFCSQLNISVTYELMNFFQQKFKSNKTKVNEDFYTTIKKLKENGYKVILFSNSCCLNQDKLDLTSLDIDGIFYSYEIGYTKSDKESYEYIENKLNCKPEEILHIGDTLSSDYEMPRKYGWNSLYYGLNDNKNIESIKTLKYLINYLEQ